MVTTTRKFGRVTPARAFSYWFLIKQRIHNKLMLFAYVHNDVYVKSLEKYLRKRERLFFCATFLRFVIVSGLSRAARHKFSILVRVSTHEQQSSLKDYSNIFTVIGIELQM